jgi:predicted N-acyltransferase
VLPHLEAVVADLCWRETRPLVGVSNVAERDLPLWRAHGYLAARQHDHMVLDVDGLSYDQYVERLPIEDRRELRRVWRKGAAAGADLSVEPLAGQGDQLYPLMAETFARHGTPASAIPLASGLFAAIEREMPGDAVVVAGRIGGQLAGFFLGIRQGDALLLPLAGLRYELAHPSCLYFVLIDHLIRWSIDQGLRRIYGGMSNERQKARHGFRPQSHWFCIRAHPGFLNRAVGLALDRRRRLAQAPARATLATPGY